ncbi:MAG: corrinoid protein [Candidatus Bathyarchaeia archaeon]|nr:corrinoid protein [Candidatus Bathyarchaeota archaeon]
MSLEDILEKIKKAVVNLDAENIQRLCREALEAGITPYEIIMRGFSKGLEIVGEKYEREEYYLAELVVAGEVVKEGMKILEPYLERGEVKKIGRVVIGTVKGDLHDIGKNIVKTLLRAVGFDVIDLGVDVPPEKFIEAVKKHKPDIVAMSALMTTTMNEMENVIKMLRENGLRDKVKVIIGGAPITKEFAEKIGADAAAEDAIDGVNICKSWVSEGDSCVRRIKAT